MSENAVPALPTEEDYRRYDRVWQRVSPVYDPYPEVRQRRKPPVEEREGNDLGRLREFLRRAIGDGSLYRDLACCAPTLRDRRCLCALAERETAHVRSLQAMHFLLTGECWRLTVVLPCRMKRRWCDALRERYHEESFDAARYRQAAAETEDQGLKRLYQDLAREKTDAALCLRRMVERSI